MYEKGPVNSRFPFVRNKKFLILAGLIALIGLAGVVLGMHKVSKEPSFCASCHIMKPYYQSWIDSSLLARSHAEKGVVCLDCHESSYPDKIKQGIKYVTGDFKEPLDQRRFSREKCLECHVDFDRVKASTDYGNNGNPHAPPHSNEMECTMCHSMHQQSQLYCSQCHDFEWAKQLGQDWVVQ